jgi:SAM-dependent methyltransferase
MKWDHIQSAKEVCRHFLYKAGLGMVMSAIRQQRGYKVSHLGRAGVAERFRAIYGLGVWVNSSDQMSSSGKGSEIAATGELFKELPKLVARLDCTVFLDIGCGDWNWMQRLELPCEYVGVDIVPEVIESNKRFERSGVRFLVANAMMDPLPNSDIAFCREVLFHLSFHDAFAVIENVRRSARWLVATTDTRIWFNSDIPTGDFRKINLQRPPFSFPPPRVRIADDVVSRGRMLGVWAMDELRRAYKSDPSSRFLTN